MFNLGFSELLILGVIALIFIGPKELPEIAKALGRLMSEFKRATGDLSSTLLNPQEHLKEHLKEQINLPKFEDKSIFHSREGQEQKEYPHHHEDAAAKSVDKAVKNGDAPATAVEANLEASSSDGSSSPTSQEQKPS